MALIECPDCHKEVSDKAVSCPSCGYPFKPADVPTSDIPGHGIPALFSFFVPGLGQLVKGDIFGAIWPYLAAVVAVTLLTEISHRVLAVVAIWLFQIFDTYRVKKKVDWAKLNEPIKGSRRTCGIVAILFAVLISASLLSYDLRDRSLFTPSGNLEPEKGLGVAWITRTEGAYLAFGTMLPHNLAAAQNWSGVAGAYLAGSLFLGFGYAAYFLPLLLAGSAYYAFRDSHTRSRFLRFIGYLGILLSMAVLSSLSIDYAGGILGELLGIIVLSQNFGQIGAYLIAIILLGVSIIFVVHLKGGPVGPPAGGTHHKPITRI